MGAGEFPGVCVCAVRQRVLRPTAIELRANNLTGGDILTLLQAMKVDLSKTGGTGKCSWSMRSRLRRAMLIFGLLLISGGAVVFFALLPSIKGARKMARETMAKCESAVLEQCASNYYREYHRWPFPQSLDRTVLGRDTVVTSEAEQRTIIAALTGKDTNLNPRLIGVFEPHAKRLSNGCYYDPFGSLYLFSFDTDNDGNCLTPTGVKSNRRVLVWTHLKP